MHAGALSLRCSTCHERGAEERRSLGCDPTVAAAEPAWQYEESGGEVVSFMNCPGLYIPERVWAFWAIYKAYTRGRARLPALAELPRKYAAFCDVYETYLSLFQSRAAEGARQQDNTSAFRGMRF